MSQAYVVGNITVRSPQKWAEYTRQVPGTLAAWGAEVVFRGKNVAALAGSSPHQDIVALRFPDVASVNGWYASPAYQRLIPLREEAADVVLLCYQG